MSKKQLLLNVLLRELEILVNFLGKYLGIPPSERKSILDCEQSIQLLLRILQKTDHGKDKKKVIERLRSIRRKNIQITWSIIFMDLNTTIRDLKDGSESLYYYT